MEEVKPTIVEVFNTIKQRSGDAGESAVEVASEAVESAQVISNPKATQIRIPKIDLV